MNEKKCIFAKKMPMIENLSDAEILQRLKRYDEKVTNEFFYDTCRIAYYMDNKKYELEHKQGMDFFSLAHEYYIRLCNNSWRQLEKRKPGITLADWTMNGFHFLVRERLKAFSQGHFEESLEERASKGKLLFDTPVDNRQEEIRKMVEDICHTYYKSDHKAQTILRMILIKGLKGKEVATMIGITPAAVSQRFHTMMNQIVKPYFIKYYDEPSIQYAHLPKSSSSWFDISPMRRMEIEQPRMVSTDETKEKTFSSSRITPSIIHSLQMNEIFVFGSDLQGAHCGNTTFKALMSIGAQLGRGIGPQDQCYAIPTIVGALNNILPYIDDFFKYVVTHPKQTFLVTPIGCDIAGFAPEDIAPMFDWAKEMDNICLPQDFWDVIGVD